MNYSNFINKDFRNRSQPTQNKRHPGLRWLMLAAGSVVIGVVLANTASQDISPQADTSTVINDKQLIQATNSTYKTIDTESSSRIQLKLPQPSDKLSANPEDSISTADTPVDDGNNSPNWQAFKVKRGDSLSLLFDRAGIKPDQLVELMRLGKETDELRRLHPGDTINIIKNDEGQLQALNYQIDTVRYLQVERNQQQLLVAQILKHQIEVRTAYASGVIESSLFLASAKSGLSENLTMELANIFGWDIDFALDIRKGDQFTVIYEQRFKNGNKIKDGNILAAEFINQGKTFRALRYIDPVTGYAGYYSPDGHSLRKAFLRSPVNFSRISSRFTTSRYHPILHKFRSHKGVDYAAARGTPVRASGDGKVIFKGRKGGYGRAIILKHGSRYTTLYAHLNSFNRKIRNGVRVKQGQVIGYVGSSGLASGPHLHYEFRVNGVHRNPLTVKFPSTRPIPKRYRENFKLTTQGYIAQLDVLSRNNALALNDKL